MSGKNNSQSSQSNFNPHSVEYGEQIMDFLVTLKDWENDECRTMLSRTLETEKDFVQLQAEENVFKDLVVEHIVRNLDEKHANLLLAYMRTAEEKYDTAVSMGDMLLYDQITMKTTKDKER